MPNRAANWRAKVAADLGGTPLVVERARNGLTVHLGDGQYRLMRSVGPVHTRDGREIDTDWQDDGTTFRERVLDFGLRADRTGGRTITPRPDHPDETMTVGRPEWERPILGWRPIPVTGFSREGHVVTFTGPGPDVRLAIKPDGVRTLIVLETADQVIRYRWPLTLSGLTYEVRQYQVGWTDDDPPQPIYETGPTLVSQSDDEIVLWLGTPRWEDSPHPDGPPLSGEMSHTWDGTWLTYTPILPPETVFPVTLDPDFHAHVATGYDDGYVAVALTSFDRTSTILMIGDVSGDYDAWARIQSVTIPKDSTVSEAHFHWTSTAARSDNLTTRIYLVAENDHAAPVSYNGSDPKWVTHHGAHTSNYADYSFTTDTTAGGVYQSSSWAAAAQEVFARSGWASGQDIGIHWDDNGSGSGQYQMPASYENTTYGEIYVDITYTEPATNDSTSPASIATVAAVPSPTVKGSAKASPAAIAVMAALLAVTVQAGQQTSPASIAAVAALPAVGVEAGQQTSPASIAAVAAMPAPTVGAGQTTSPASIAVVAVLPAPTVQAGQQTSPDPIAVVAALPAPTFAAGQQTSPASIAAVVAIPAPTVGSGQATAPASIACVALLPAPTVQAGQQTSPASIAVVAALPAPAVQAGQATSPESIPVVAAMPAVTTATTSPTSPSSIACVVTLPVVAVQAGQQTSPDPIAVVAALPVVAVQAGQATAPTSIPVVVSLPTPTTGAGQQTSPDPIAVVAAMPAPTTGAGSSISVTPIACVAALPAPTLQVSESLSPTTIRVVAALPAPTLTAGQQTSPATIQVVVAFPGAVAGWYIPVVMAWDAEATLVEAWDASAALVESWDAETALVEAWNAEEIVVEGWDAEATLIEAWDAEALEA